MDGMSLACFYIARDSHRRLWTWYPHRPDTLHIATSTLAKRIDAAPGDWSDAKEPWACKDSWAWRDLMFERCRKLALADMPGDGPAFVGRHTHDLAWLFDQLPKANEWVLTYPRPTDRYPSCHDDRDPADLPLRWGTL